MKASEVVLITGASAGIGRATAHEFAKRGASIGLLARNIDGLEGAKREVEALGGKAICCICDVTDTAQIEKAANEIEAAFGPIDTWINNAMVSFLAPLKEVTAKEYRRVTDVCYHGQVYGTMEALRRMRTRNQGSIVLVGSALAYRGIPLQTAYCGAKHAIQGFFDSLRAELIHEGSNIKLTMVQLPGVNTTQFKLTRNKMPNKPRPMGAIYQPEEAARGIVYAADHDIREVLVGMPSFQTIWGNKLFPGFADNVLGHTAYKGQLTNQIESPEAPDYLFDPVPGDHGYKGGFDDKESFAGPGFWSGLNRVAGAILVGGLAAAGTALVLKAAGLASGDSNNHFDDRYTDQKYRSEGDAWPANPDGFGSYPKRDFSGIHGGAPHDFDYNKDQYTRPGDVSVAAARQREGTIVLDAID